MPEQVFRSPGYFEQETELSISEQGPYGTPYGIVGTSERGPAFIPISVGSFPDFESRFGTLNPAMYAPYAVRFASDNKSNIQFVRTLGAGAVSSSSDIDLVRTTGQVTNAGFAIQGSTSAFNKQQGAVQFLVGRHVVQTNETFGMPMFTDNASFSINGSGQYANLVRGVLFSANDTRIMITGTLSNFSNTAADTVSVDSNGKFKLVISSSAGTSFATTDGIAGVKMFTASLDPSSQDYIVNVLNGDPIKFGTEKHFLYSHFPVDAEVATIDTSTSVPAVGLLSGSNNTSVNSGDTTMSFANAFGKFNTRYTTPKTTNVISQPFGGREYDLFYFESIDDGAFANNQFKVSISNLRASTDPTNLYGTFSVSVRLFSDLDTDPVIVEQYPVCSLDPKSDSYIAKVIGDKKQYFYFDSTSDQERRVKVDGTYNNKSRVLRVVVSQQVKDKTVPAIALPFGFRGPGVLHTSPGNTDHDSPTAATTRMTGVMVGATAAELAMSGSIVPPLPLRFKVTKGAASTTAGYAGSPGTTEVVDNRFYWGVKLERNNVVLNPNVNAQPNKLIENLTKFQGLEKLDVLVTGSNTDVFNNNKFSLAKVALSNTSVAQLTSTINVHMRDAAYIRNATPDPTTYTVNDGVLSGRLTFASLLKDGATTFNRFSDFAKFTTVFYGGFDGLNILDKDNSRMNDKSTSTEVGGGATSTYVPTGFATQQNGSGITNSNIIAYQIGAKLLTDPVRSTVNILALPGIREPLVMNYALNRMSDYGLGMLVMDIPEYTDVGDRIFDSNTAPAITSVEQSITEFEGRAIDNNYGAVYFPDVLIQDDVNNRRVRAPASVAALSVLAYNDKVAFPWYVPAGFNRGSLEFVKNVSIKLSQNDRDNLYDARINPIASFPKQGYVVFGQKNLQQATSSLNRINVRRMLNDLKLQLTVAARKIIFEQITPELRGRIIKDFTPILTTLQTRQGIGAFKIICDDTNNTINDIQSNRMNGTIIITPIRGIEYIDLNFIIDPRTGISFGT